MPYVITEPCIGTKDTACRDVCPVNAIHDEEEKLYINPEECVDCGICVTVCPVSAIFHETNVPTAWLRFSQGV